MSAATGYVVGGVQLTEAQYYAFWRSMPLLVKRLIIALTDAYCAFNDARRLAEGRRARLAACGYDVVLIRVIVRRQRHCAQRAVRRAIYALALMKSLRLCA